MSKLIVYYRQYIPESARKIIHTSLYFIPNFIGYIKSPRRKWDKKIDNIRKKSISYFQKHGTEEQKSLINFLKTNKSFYFPYEWTKKYTGQGISVFRENDFPYVLRNGKKLFGKKRMSNEDWKILYNHILLEQDEESPHKYITDNRLPNPNSVFADIGAADGFLALDVIDNVKKLYIFECNIDWIEALKMTFKPWTDKVEIVNKYVSDIDSDNSVTLDTFFAEKEIDFIKADIEGFEEQMLRGGSNVFQSKIKKCLLCCYHRTSAEEYFTDFLKSKGFDTIEVNKGLMIWACAEEAIGEPLKAPFTRHGVMYAEKSAQKN